MLKEVKRFLEEIGDLSNKHTNCYFPWDHIDPPTDVENFPDAIKKLKVRTELIAPTNPVYIGLIKGALDKANGETFEDVYNKLGGYIRRGQYVELLWMATCIFLAKNTKQLEMLANQRMILAPPGIYELWKKRKKELQIRRIKHEKGKNKLQVLKPVEISEEELLKEYQMIKDVSGKFSRVGGGDFQVNAKKTRRGWVVQCIFIKRDPFVPDGNLLDIEATKGLNNIIRNYREIEIIGYPSAPNPMIKKIVSERNIGFVTRRRCGAENDFSIETAIACYTPGDWQEAKDIQHNRQIIYVEIGPEGEITFRDFKPGNHDNMSKLLIESCSEKVLLALSIAKDISRVLNSGK